MTNDKDDSWHNEILEDKVAHEANQLAAIRQAMTDEYSEDDAWALYGNSIPHLRDGFKK